jgi:hypothetical protein
MGQSYSRSPHIVIPIISDTHNIIVHDYYVERDVERDIFVGYNTSIPINITAFPLSTQNSNENEIPSASQIRRNDIELAYPELQVEKKINVQLFKRCEENSLTIRFIIVITFITVMLYFTFSSK